MAAGIPSTSEPGVPTATSILAVYNSTDGLPYITSTIPVPSGYFYASSAPGGVIYYTNSASITSSTTDLSLVLHSTTPVLNPAPPSSGTSSTTSAVGLAPTVTSLAPPMSTPLTTSPSTLRSEMTSTSSKLATSTSSKNASASTASTNHGNTSPSSNRLPNGVVAGIVIGVAIGLALLTLLATILVLRRRPKSGGKRGYGASKERGTLDAEAVNQQGRGLERKEPFVAETSGIAGSLENHIPQSADDKTVQNAAKNTLDQIELHVENFYQGVARSSPRPVEADVATFNSPYLSASLGALLAQSRNAVPLIKHALTHFITDSISLIANPKSTLLPDEFVLLPSTVKAANLGASTKTGKIRILYTTMTANSTQGFAQSMSQWRVLTAYLRPKPSQDPMYITERDQRIDEIVQVFSRTFAPWRTSKYSDEDRVQSLSATLKESADLGLFIFAQPSDLQFRWPKQGEVGLNRLAIAPALLKLTDEKGNTLTEPQVMLKTVMHKI